MRIVHLLLEEMVSSFYLELSWRKIEKVKKYQVREKALKGE